MSHLLSTLTSKTSLIQESLVLPLLIAALLVSLASASAYASDRSFSTVVKHIESNYDGKRMKTFGMISFARLLVKVIKPAGVKNFKVVMFKEVDFSHFPGEVEFRKFINDTVDPSWQPMAQIISRRNKQWVYVYTQQENEHAKFLVIAMQAKEAFVVQFKFDPEKLAAFLEDPKIMGISLTGNKDGSGYRDRGGDERGKEIVPREAKPEGPAEKGDKKNPPLPEFSPAT